MKRSFFLSQLAVACLLMTGCGQKPADANSFDDIVASRRSIRDYDASKTISSDARWMSDGFLLYFCD